MQLAALSAYALGATLLLIRWAVGMRWGARLCRAAQPTSGAWDRSLDARVSTAIDVPASFGSAILLPSGYKAWDTDALRAVIDHESAHVRNRDGQRLWMAEIYRAIFWYNRLAHWLCRRLRVLSELTSDDAALAQLQDRSGYRDLLLQFASRAQPARTVRATVAMASRETLAERLEKLRQAPAPASAKRPMQRALAASFAVVVVALTAGCAARPLVLSRVQARAVPCVRAHSRPLSRFYPAALQRRHIEGIVQVRLSIDIAGRVTRAVVLEQRPRDSGLAAAALRFVKSSRFNNTLLRPVVMNLNVRFRLRKPPGGARPAATPRIGASLPRIAPARQSRRPGAV